MASETGTDILWLLFSFLLLDPARQVEILGGLPASGTASEKMLTENAAVYLYGTIENFSDSWLDEFDVCPNAAQLFELIAKMDSRQSYETFMTDDKWMRLRSLAKSALDEVGLEPMPVPLHIDLHAYMEIVSSDDVAPFIDLTVTEQQGREWAKAEKLFSRNRNAKISCPVCKVGLLKLEKVSPVKVGNLQVRISCETCGSHNVADIY